MKDLIEHLILKVQELDIFNHVNVWNNQLDEEEQAFALPACFIEIENNLSPQQLTTGGQIFDIIVNFHVINEYYQSNNIDIYNLKNNIYQKFQLYKPPFCAIMTRTEEIQVENHDQIQEYQIKFATNIVDLTFEKYFKLNTSVPSNLIINGSFY